jgi:DNA-binding response OmpR family regulator
MNYSILWVDDEIEHLRAHIMFLEKKGYDVTVASNGLDAIEQCQGQTFDLVLLDEMMPGLNGLETLQRIKDIQPQTPVVMVTKSEEEDIMDQAIGSKIADYLIKPVNPMQILLALKKHVHQREIVTEVAQQGYQQQFMDISAQITQSNTFDDWCEVYRRLVRWEIELSEANSSMTDMLQMQKEEANNDFAKFIKKNYQDWMTGDKPLMSDRIMPDYVFPMLSQGEKVFMIVIDNFRYDQWRVLAEEIGDMFDIDERLYCSILPTATMYARNAIFSGLMPEQIAKMFPELWVDEESEEGKNINEAPLIQTLLERYRRKETFSYHKLNDSQGAERLLNQFNSLKAYNLNVVVINFIDMLSHARTESKMVRELANNEAAYRSISLSWVRHSVMGELLKRLAATDYRIVITTDHGSIRCDKPVKIVGDKNTNTNLRYKTGRKLTCQSKDVYETDNPKSLKLPSVGISSSYVFATGNSFFAYPNNYSHYVQYYKDTYQHGGISMEEMIIPLISMKGRKR